MKVGGDGARGSRADGIQIEVVKGVGARCGGEGGFDALGGRESVARWDDGEDVVGLGDEVGV